MRAMLMERICTKKTLHCARSFSLNFTKGIINMSTGAFCVFKRSQVSVQAQRERRLDRKLPQKHCGCLVGWSSNMTLLSLSFTCPPVAPTHLFSPLLMPSSLSPFLIFSHNEYICVYIYININTTE